MSGALWASLVRFRRYRNRLVIGVRQMDFLLVFAEWLDLGLTGMGVVLGAILYRRRALLTDTLWWMREHYRQQTLQQVLYALDSSGRVSAEEALAELSRQWKRPLTELDREMAQSLLAGGNRHNRAEGKEDHREAR